jgi:hypothetical protein
MSNYDQTASLAEQVKAKWEPILEHPELPTIEDAYKKNVTAVLLENQEQYLSEAIPNSGMQNGMITGIGSNAHAVGQVQSFDPVLISLVRRSMPNLVAYDICGVQPMTGPTGLIFAMKSNYVSATDTRGDEALFDEARTGYATRAGGITGDDPALTSASVFGNAGVGLTGDPIANFVNRGITNEQAENLGSDASDNAFQQMAFSIERTAVQAKTRALKAEYSTELAQDLRAVHGLDAETELANILSTEILSEINREVVRTILKVAKLGCQQTDLKGKGTTPGAFGIAGGAGGIYDILSDSDGRWSAERFRGLLFQIERECNLIARQTRRGKGNIVICSSDVAAALALSGSLQSTPMGGGSLTVDDTGNTFVGTLNGRLKVYIDPYADFNYCVVGYKGASQYDAGLFYCPYVPLQMVRAVGEDTFQPKIGFKTRYGLVSNPFVKKDADTADGETLGARLNQYYRVFRIDNLHGINSGQGATQ